MAELTPEKIEQLSLALVPLAQARYLLTKQRENLLRELARASTSILANGQAAAEVNRPIAAYIFDVTNGIAPETEYDAIEASLKAAAARARATINAVDNERSNLVAAITAVIPVLSDPAVDSAIKETVALCNMIDDLLTPKVEEPEA
jgi:hypothetical protein